MIKVLIADDQKLIRESLQIVLNVYPDIEVIGTVGDGTEVFTSVGQLKTGYFDAVDDRKALSKCMELKKY